MARMALNKTEFAKELGISRASLYYQPKRAGIDEEVKKQIESVMGDHPDYGHKRIAIDLKLNKKRILRVMKKFKIKPYRRKAKPPFKPKDNSKPATKYLNLIEDLEIDRPGLVWVTDFTYIKFHGQFIYLATVIDLFTREVVGINISRYHNRFLVMGAVLNALENNLPPKYIHSDQGSEYDSEDYTNLIEGLNIQISMSRKGSPWENGYQESFFGRFKTGAGDLNRFDTTGELVEYIYKMLHYYNYERIHSALKMPPVKYRQNYLQKSAHSMSKELGT